MLVKVINADSTSLEVDVSGIDQSLLQIVQDELLSDNRVTFAAFNKPHPLLKNQTMKLVVKEGDPKRIFVEGCERGVEKADKTIMLLSKVMARA